jgi:hypothetical protein
MLCMLCKVADVVFKVLEVLEERAYANNGVQAFCPFADY